MTETKTIQLGFSLDVGGGFNSGDDLWSIFGALEYPTDLSFYDFNTLYYGGVSYIIKDVSNATWNGSVLTPENFVPGNAFYDYAQNAFPDEMVDKIEDGNLDITLRYLQLSYLDHIYRSNSSWDSFTIDMGFDILQNYSMTISLTMWQQRDSGSNIYFAYGEVGGLSLLSDNYLYYNVNAEGFSYSAESWIYGLEGGSTTLFYISDWYASNYDYKDDRRNILSDSLVPLGEVNSGSASSGWITSFLTEPGPDKDWFQTLLKAGITYRVAAVGSGNQNEFNTFFSIRDASGKPVVGTNGRYGWQSYDDYDGKNAVVEFTPPTDGTYYIVVGGGGLNYATEKGHYTVSVTEVQEAGSSRGMALEITSGTAVRGFIGFGADPVDMYRFEATQSGTVAFGLSDSAPGTDIQVTLQDDRGRTVANSRVEAGRDYYLRVTPSLTLNSQSPYTLTLTFAEVSGTTAADLFGSNGGKILFLTRLARAAYALSDTLEAQVDDVNEGSPERSAYLRSLRDFNPGFRALNHTDLRFGLAPDDYFQFQYVNTAAFKKVGLSDGTYVNQNAAALVFRTDHALFLAFRGTNDNSDNVLFGRPDVDDWMGFGNNSGMDRHYDLLTPLIQRLDDYLRDPGSGITEVYVAGHSLGAGMATRFMSDHTASDWTGIKFEAGALANPGYYPIAALPDSRITNFLNQDDSISAADIFKATPGHDVRILFDDANDTLSDNPTFDWTTFGALQGGQHSIQLYEEIIKYLDFAANGIDAATLRSIDKIVVPSFSTATPGAWSPQPLPIGGDVYFNWGEYGSTLDSTQSNFRVSGPVTMLLAGGPGDDTYRFSSVLWPDTYIVIDSEGASDRIIINSTGQPDPPCQ